MIDIWVRVRPETGAGVKLETGAGVRLETGAGVRPETGAGVRLEGPEFTSVCDAHRGKQSLVQEAAEAAKCLNFMFPQQQEQK